MLPVFSDYKLILQDLAAKETFLIMENLFKIGCMSFILCTKGKQHTFETSVEKFTVMVLMSFLTV